MAGFGRGRARRGVRRFIEMKRRDLLSAVALVVAVAMVLAAAFNAPGYPTPDYELHDAGVWLSRTADKAVGRTNAQIGQVDLRLVTRSVDFDLHQQGDLVVVHHKLPTGNGLAVIDGKAGSLADDIALPAASAFEMVRRAAGDVVGAVLHDGSVWRTAESVFGELKVGAGEDATQADLDVEGGTHLALGDDGVAWVYAPAQGKLVGVATDGSEAGTRTVIEKPADHQFQVSVVGTTPVVLDATDGEVLLPGEKVVDLKPFGTAPSFALQQSGPARPFAAVATDTHVLDVPISGGSPGIRTDKGTGGPVQPLVVGSCVNAAWSAAPHASTVCPGRPAEVVALDGMPSGRPMRFRTNRGKVLINELQDGQSFLLQAGQAIPIDWSQAVTEDLLDRGEDSQSTQQQEQNDREKDQKPPDAKDDLYGTRPDRPVVLKVLENDTDPNNDVLVVDEITNVTQDAVVQIVGQGTQVQVTPAPGRTESITFDYRAYDGFDGRDKAKVTVEVHGYDRNSPPRLKPQETFVVAGATVTHNVLTDAVDPDGDPMALVVPIELDSSQGTVTAEPSGVITFTAPGVGFQGDVRVPFVVVDDQGAKQAAELLVHVLPPDRANPPKVRGDHATTSVGRETVIDVLANDTDADGDALRVVGVGAFPGATLTVDADQKVRVIASTPGVVNVEYAVTDGPHVESAPLRVDVIDASTQQPPIAVRDDAVLRPGVPAIVDVLANDIDANDDVLVVVTVNVPPLANLVVEVVDHRFLRVRTADGGVLAETTAFTYTISDGSTQSVGTVVVRPGPATSVDQQPRAVDDDVKVRAGNVAAFDVLENDSDPEGGRLKVSLPPAEELGELASRVFAQGALLRFVAPDQPGSFRIPYAVTDPGGNRAAAYANVTVLPRETLNSGPIALTLIARGVAGQAISITVPVATIDPDGDEVTILGVADAAPTHGTVTEVGIDRIVYVPDKYEGGFYGTDVFTYRVRDERGAEATGTIRVGVVPPASFNSPPVAIDDIRQVSAGGKLDIDPVVNDSDPDGDALSIDTAVDLRLPPDVPWSATVDRDRIVFDGKGLAEGAEAAFGYSVTDGVLTDTGIVRVVATFAENAPPNAVDDRAEAQVAGAAVVVKVLENDSDPDGSADAMKVVSVTGLDGAAPAASGRELRFTMPAAPVQLVYEVEDAGGARARAVVRVPLANADRLRPTAISDEAETAQGEAITVDVLANDVVSPDTSKTLLAVEGSRGGVCSVAGDRVSFAPTPDFVGLGGCAYVVGDGAGDDPLTLRAIGMLGVTVKRSGNSPPVFREQPLRVVADSETKVDLRPAASDPDDGDVGRLTFSDVQGTTDVVTASFDGSELTVAAKANAVEGTVLRLTFSVSDGGEGGTIEGAVTVTVTEYSGALAVVVADRAETFQGISTKPIQVLANDQLAENGEPLKIVSTSAPTGGTLTVTESEITFVPAADFFGETTFTYTVDDGTEQEKRRVTGTVTVVVVGRPDRPPTPAVIRESKAIVLDWGVPAANGAPITEYKIRVSGGPVQGESVRSSTANSFRFDGLTNGAAYTFQIAAINSAVTAGLESGTIAEPEFGPASPSIVANAIPPVPSIPTAAFDPAGQAVKVTWNQPAGDGTDVKKYVLQISPPPASGGAEQTFDAVANPMTVTIGNLVNGTPYTFRVRAINDLSGPGSLDGVSEFSPESVPETPATRPDAPLKPTIGDKGDGQITVRWQEPKTNGDPIRTYEVEVTRNGVVTGVTKIVDPSVRQTIITTDNGSEFTFRVRAENKAGFSDYGPASDKAVSYGVPFGVTDLSADVDSAGIGSGQAQLDFSAPRDNGSAISSYEYRFSTNGGGAYGGWSPLPSNRRLSSLANGTSYVFQVRGCNARGCATEFGNASNAVVPYGNPTTPSVSGGNSGGNITWNWSPSGGNGRNIVNYELRVDGGAVFSVPGGQTSHTQGGYSDDGSTHTLTVVAVTDAADADRKRGAAGSGSVTRPSPPPRQVNVRKDGVSSGSACGSSANTSTCQWLALQLLYFPPNSTYTAECQVVNAQGVWQTVYSAPVSTNGSGSYGWARPGTGCYVDARRARIVVDGQASNEVNTYA